MSEATPYSGHEVATTDLASNDTPVAATSSGRGTQRRQQRGNINANHLLNFQSGARETQQTAANPNRRRPAQQRSSRSSRPPAYDRTKFLQANFRFIISDASEIRKYEADPDLMLNWDDIAAVDVITTSEIQCPITLGQCITPCITPCGHIFSEEAIMAHMISTGGPELRVSSACPVCTTQVAARELRPVIIRHVSTIAVGTGESITFKLLKRGIDSILPHPVGDNEHQLEINSGGSSGGKTALSPTSASATATAAWQRGNVQVSTSNQSNNLNKDSNNKGEKEKEVPCNLYAKFTAVSDPFPSIWSPRVQILAQKSAQLLAEGGHDATYEVPPILAAIDIMANRARAWTERRQRLLLEKLDDEEAAAALAGGALAVAELAGKEAMEAVKRVAEKASKEEEQLYQKSVAVHALEEAFPVLSLGMEKPSTSIMEKIDAAAEKKTAPSLSQDSFNTNINASDIHTTSTNSTPSLIPPSAAPPPPLSSEYYFYQSIDGQLIFLSPFNMKMLVDSVGACYTSLPHEITAPVLDLEEIEQNETTRKKMKWCGHLPLGGSFKLCEIDLRNILPAEALAPFEGELTQRGKKRMQIAKLEARKHHREIQKANSIAAAKAAAAAGPSAEELAAMPLPGAFSDPVPVPVPKHSGELVFGGKEDETAAAGASPASTSSFPGDSSGGGISFARIAKMGFAATGPALGEGLGSSPTSPWGETSHGVSTTGAAAWPGRVSPTTSTPGGVWGSNSDDTSGISAQIDAALASSRVGEGGGYGKKKGKKIMLLSTSHRR